MQNMELDFGQRGNDVMRNYKEETPLKSFDNPTQEQLQALIDSIATEQRIQGKPTVHPLPHPETGLHQFGYWDYATENATTLTRLTLDDTEQIRLNRILKGRESELTNNGTDSEGEDRDDILLEESRTGPRAYVSPSDAAYRGYNQ